MRGTAILALCLSWAAVAATFTQPERELCQEVAEKTLKQYLLSEDRELRDGTLTAEEINTISVARVSRGKLYVTAEARVFIPGPYDGVRVVIYKYETRPAGQTCQIVGEELIEDEIYD